ncbi:hypothetical protein ACVDHJ_01595 [Aeromonas sp. 25-281]
MKKINITILVLGCIALLAAFMPMGEKGRLYVDLSHMGGATVLLYFLPILLVVSSVLALNDKIYNLKAWYIPVAVIGLLLSMLTAYAGVSQVEAFASMSRRFANSGADEASIGIGACILIATYSFAQTKT